jgi:hypothetical protein
MWGLISGLLYIPLCLSLSRFVFWPVSFQISAWLLLAGYAVLLSRWAPKSLSSISLPLLLLFLAALFVRSTGTFLFTAFVMLGWIRSGICFKTKPFFKRLGAEIGLSLAAGLLAFGAVPATAITWALGIWLFFLIQALYFVLFDDGSEAKIDIVVDPFEKAKMAAQKILSSQII